MSPYRTLATREPEPPKKPLLCRLWLHFWSGTFYETSHDWGEWVLYCTRCDKKIVVKE